MRARARRLGLLRALLLVAEVGLLVLLLGLPPGLLANDAARVAYLGVGGLAIALALVLALRILGRSPGDIQLARAVEASVPGHRLGDGLRSSVELAGQAPDGEGVSRPLVALHLDATASALAGLDPRAVVTGPELGRPARRVGLLLALVLCIQALRPGSLSQWWAELSRGAPQAVAGQALPRTARTGVDPVLADLRLVYRYPAYTGLVPRTEEGASGDIQALRGTEVEIAATADRAIAAARLHLEPGDAVAMELDGGRAVRARLVLKESGTWQAELGDAGGNWSRDPVRHAIAVDEDTAPAVKLEEPATDLETDETAVLDLVWSASDDFGLGELALVIEREGKLERRPLGLRANEREQRGRQRLALASFALIAGEEILVSIEASDNDTISGPKRGISEVRRIRIRSVETRHDQFLAVLERLLEEMLGTLDTALTASRAAAHTVRSVAEIEDAIAGRLALHRERLDEALRALWQDPIGSQQTYDDLAAMVQRLQALVDESTSTLKREAPALARPLGDDALVRTLAALRDREVGELESDVLRVDEILHREKGAVLKALARQIAEDQKALASLLDEYRRTGDPATLSEATRLIGKMKARVAEFERRMASSERGVVEEFVNMDAIREQLEALAGEPMAELERKIREGDLDSATKQAAELAARLARAAAAFETLPRGMGALAQQRSADELGRTIERVAALRDAEGRVVESTDALKREQEARRFGSAKGAAELLSRELRRAEKVATAAREAAAELDRDETLLGLAIKRRRLDELSREAGERLARGAEASALDDLREELFRLREELADPTLGAKLEARDRLGEAAKQAAEAAQALGARTLEEALRSARGAERRLREAGRRLEGGGSGAEGAAAEASELVRNLEAMQRLNSSNVDGEGASSEAPRLGELARKQRALRSEAGEIRGAVDRIAEENPELPPDLGTNLSQAADYMDVAARGLDAREVADGHRNAVAARERLDAALESLQDAQKACNGSGSGGGGGGSGAGSGAMAYTPAGVQGQPRFGGRNEDRGRGSDRDGSDGGASAEKVEIPQNSAARAPEAFRKDVLEGMKEPRPGGWEESVERYYRRLVQ